MSDCFYILRNEARQRIKTIKLLRGGLGYDCMIISLSVTSYPLHKPNVIVGLSFHMASHPPAGWLQLIHTVVSELQFQQKSKPQFVSHLSKSCCWQNKSKGQLRYKVMEKQTLPFVGRCAASDFKGMNAGKGIIWPLWIYHKWAVESLSMET